MNGKRKKEGIREGLSVESLMNGHLTDKRTLERGLWFKTMNGAMNRRSRTTNCLYSFVSSFFSLSLSPAQTVIMSAQIFTYEEVSKHNTRNDLYMIIDKKVYDITKFLDEVRLQLPVAFTRVDD